MEVIEIKPSGYCLGVIKAISTALNVRKENPHTSIYVFGLLVHNDDVTKELDSYAIETIDISNIDAMKRLEEFSSDDIVIFTAHGHPQSYEEVLKRNNVRFVDTTCSFVRKNIELINQNKIDRQIIYIGKNNHPETIAALSQSNRVLLYEKGKSFDYSLIDCNDPLVINQTTLSLLELKDIHKEIKERIKDAIIENEICSATRIRQEKLSNIDKDVDLIIIIGSNKSSNSKKLYEIALQNKDVKKIVMVNSLDEVKNYDLKEYKKAVLASGTSTSINVIKEIKEYLEEI